MWLLVAQPPKPHTRLRNTGNPSLRTSAVVWWRARAQPPPVRRDRLALLGGSLASQAASAQAAPWRLHRREPGAAAHVQLPPLPHLGGRQVLRHMVLRCARPPRLRALSRASPLVSVVWLVFVGIVMSNTPVYVKSMTDQQAVLAKSNAFTAAGLYGATLIVSLLMFRYRSNQESRASGRITTDADADLSVPLVVADDRAAATTRPGTGPAKKPSRPSGNSGGMTTI